MKSFNDAACELSLITGTAWLSRFELARLAPGSTVLTDRIAGTGFELRLNGARLAEADTVLVELHSGEEARPAARLTARLTARILAFSPALPAEVEPVRGSALTGLLPVTVSFGGATVPLGSLSGLGRMSLVELGIPAYREGEAWRADASLLVAGIEAARGVVSVSGEFMALEIGDLAPGFPSPAFADAPFASTGRVIPAGDKTSAVKTYDFSKPDCFTRRQIDALAGLHERALKTLNLIDGNLPAGLRVKAADQLNFTEFLSSLPPGARVHVAPASAAVRPFLAGEERPERLFLAAAPLAEGYPEVRVTEWARASLTRPVGGSVFLSGPLAESESPAILEALRHEWQRYGAVSPRPGRAAECPETLSEAVSAFAPFADEWEMVALAEIVSDRGHELNVAYPLRVLEPVLAALDA